MLSTFGLKYYFGCIFEYDFLNPLFLFSDNVWSLINIVTVLCSLKRCIRCYNHWTYSEYMKCILRVDFLKTVKHIKDEHFVNVTKSPEKAKIPAGLNEIIFREKGFL